MSTERRRIGKSDSKRTRETGIDKKKKRKIVREMAGKRKANEEFRRTKVLDFRDND